MQKKGDHVLMALRPVNSHSRIFCTVQADKQIQVNYMSYIQCLYARGNNISLYSFLVFGVLFCFTLCVLFYHKSLQYISRLFAVKTSIKHYFTSPF